MDTTETKPEGTNIAVAEFWKGIMLGTMAGMIIAAFTYEVVDRDLRNLLKEPEMAPDRSDSRSTLPGAASEKTAA
jgi:hypothetical protein